jgi:hypothetical protein
VWRVELLDAFQSLIHCSEPAELVELPQVVAGTRGFRRTPRKRA